MREEVTFLQETVRQLLEIRVAKSKLYDPKTTCLYIGLQNKENPRLGKQLTNPSANELPKK